MTYPQIPVNGTRHDPDIAPSRQYTLLDLQHKNTPPLHMRVCSTLKFGLPMMYWTSVVISFIGAYDVDVRGLPGEHKEFIKAHAEAVRLDEKQAIAVAMLQRTFVSQHDLLTWLDTQAELPDSSVMLLHRCPPREGGAA